MATLTTGTGVGGILPQQWGPLIVEPVQTAAVCLQPQIATTIPTHDVKFHMPVINTDAAAAWLVEGATITPTDPVLTEIIVTPAKVGGLVVISSELAMDSSPAAAMVVGQGLARSIAQQLDTAFFGNVASPAPAGLGSYANALVSRVIAGVTPTNLDSFAQALALVEQDGAEITGWVANPTDALLIQTLKTGTGYNMPLLGVDATNGTSRQVLGIPLFVSAKVPQGNIWGMANTRAYVVMRTNADVQISRDAYFSSDQVAVRATMRVGFAFPTPKAVAKIALSAT